MAYQEQHSEKALSPSPKLKRKQTDIDNQKWIHHSSYPQLYSPSPDVYEKYVDKSCGSRKAALTLVLYFRTRVIFDLPLIRLLLLRPGKQIDLLHNSSKGLLNYQAALAYQRGTLQAHPCDYCANWCGPFQNCVILNDNFHGSCTNCVYQGSGSRCSLRHDSNGAINVEDDSEEEETATRAADTNLEPNSQSKKRNDTDTNLSSLGYVRRQAAINAEMRLSNYGHDDGDVVGEEPTTNPRASVFSNAAWSSAHPPSTGRKLHSCPIPGCGQDFNHPSHIPRYVCLLLGRLS